MNQWHAFYYFTILLIYLSAHDIFNEKKPLTNKEVHMLFSYYYSFYFFYFSTYLLLFYCMSKTRIFVYLTKWKARMQPAPYGESWGVFHTEVILSSCSASSGESILTCWRNTHKNLTPRRKLHRNPLWKKVYLVMLVFWFFC